MSSSTSRIPKKKVTRSTSQAQLRIGETRTPPETGEMDQGGAILARDHIDPNPPVANMDTLETGHVETEETEEDFEDDDDANGNSAETGTTDVDHLQNQTIEQDENLDNENDDSLTPEEALDKLLDDVDDILETVINFQEFENT